MTRVLVCAPPVRAERIGTRVRAEFGVGPAHVVENAIDAVGLFLSEAPTHVVIDGDVDGRGGVRAAAAMAGVRVVPTVLLVEPSAHDEVIRQATRRGLGKIVVRPWRGGVVEALFETKASPFPSLSALLTRPFEAIVLLGSAGTPHMLPALLPTLRCGGVPVVVAVHHNPRLSESFAEWLGEITGAHPSPLSPGFSMLPPLTVARADPGIDALQPNLDAVLHNVAKRSRNVLVAVGSGMQFEALDAVRTVLRRGGTLVALQPDRCPQPAMVHRLLDAGLDPMLCTQDEIARIIQLALPERPLAMVS